MSGCIIAISGIGSVSICGPTRGLPKIGNIKLSQIASWEEKSPRYAAIVDKFDSRELIPGIKTRSLGRLSLWTIVASALALQDAGIDKEEIEPSSSAVVFGTGFGCLELTEEYLRGIYQYGYDKSDPRLFPESLDNAPPSHFARYFNFRGPNITLSNRGISGEAALIVGAELIRSNVVDLVVVASGDLISQTLYQWQEASRNLSLCCYTGDIDRIPLPYCIDRDGFMPGEGVCAVILERDEKVKERGSEVYAHLLGGKICGDSTAGGASLGISPHPLSRLIRNTLDSGSVDDIDIVVSSANGSKGLDSMEAMSIIETLSGSEVDVIAPKHLFGEFDGAGILRLASALSGIGNVVPYKHLLETAEGLQLKEIGGEKPLRQKTLLLGTSSGGGRATLLFDLYPN